MLDVEVADGLVHLVLANCGDAVATGVSVEFTRELRGPEGAPVSHLPVFAHLGVLRPRRALRIFWDTAPTLLAQRDPALSFVATVSWEERGQPRQEAAYRHDLSIYRQWPECVRR